MDETFGRAGLIASTTCLSVRAIGTVLPEPEPIDNAIEAWLPVGEVGVPGSESSIVMHSKRKQITNYIKFLHILKYINSFKLTKSDKNVFLEPVEVVAIASLCVLACLGFIVGTQNVSFTDDTGLRFDERKLVESTVSTLYGTPLFVKSAS